MQISPGDLTTLKTLYDESKFWIALTSAIVTIFRGINWIKNIREKDLKEIHEGVTGVHTGVTSVRTELQSQTASVVNELRELRSDFRTFYPQPMIAARSRPPRKKATSPKKTKKTTTKSRKNAVNS